MRSTHTHTHRDRQTHRHTHRPQSLGTRASYNGGRAVQEGKQEAREEAATADAGKDKVRARKGPQTEKAKFDGRRSRRRRRKEKEERGVSGRKRQGHGSGEGRGEHNRGANQGVHSGGTGTETGRDQERTHTARTVKG